MRLVALAVGVCLLAAIAALSQFHRARATRGLARASWVVTAGATSGGGMWAAHVIAMLAFYPGASASFGWHLSVAALGVAIAINCIGFGCAATAPAKWAPAIAGTAVGIGVAGAHCLAMALLDPAGHILWSWQFLSGSVLSGGLIAGGALALALRHPGLRGTVGGAAVLTLGVFVRHAIAMAAIGVGTGMERPSQPPAFSPEALALLIAGAILMVVTISLVAAWADHQVAARARKLVQRIDELSRTKQEALAYSEGKLREQHLRLDTAINNMSQGLCMFDRTARLVVCNERYLQMYDLSSEVVKPGCPLLELLNHRLERGTFAQDPEHYVEDLLAELSSGKTINMMLELEDGRVIAIVNQPMEDGGWVATHEDITERRRAELRIAHLAHHDALTDLPNRAAFNEHLARTLDRARADRVSFAVLFIDFDRFKEVNDVFGHSVGDALLRELARRMQATAQSAFLARLGGDEFTIVAAPDAQNASAAELADRLVGELSGAFDIEGQRLQVTLSIGIAIYPDDGGDAATLLANADAALYRAKAEGRAGVRFFEAEMDMQLRDRRLLQHDLRSAIERGDLTLHYQPLARIEGEVVGFEALARWTHPTRGEITPGTFIPISEESGSIIEIGEWILRQACREAASWPLPLQVAVNLSPVQFRHGDLPTLVHQVLLETGLAPHRLSLEITEGVLMDACSRALSILRRLKVLGVQIAMDDFGTGYSSLSYLQSFPFDKIKIDRTFIANLEVSRHSAAIVRSVVSLGRSLDLPVLAEGVETQAQRAFLRQEGCTEMQGYLIGRPAPIATYADLIGRGPAHKARAG